MENVKKSKNILYFDNNATTKVADEVVSTMIPFYSENYGNPSSMHAFGGEVGKYIKKARTQVAELVGATDFQEIIFTSCGTESANMAIRGSLEVHPHKKHIITTKVEHPCVLNTFKWLEKKGYKATYLSVNSEGELDLEEFKNSITPDTALVACMWANNETGVIFPVEKMAKIIKEKNSETIFFVDAVQAAGKIPISVKDTKIDILAISGHKIHAPKGIGALYIKKGTLVNPLIIGGHQERGKRAGTENVAGIIGLGIAAELALKYLDDENTRIKYLRDKLERGLLERIFNARVNGSRINRVPNTTNISFEYIEGELILLHLSDLNICASSGSACTSGSLEPSHVLRAMGIPFTAIHGSIRFSLSRYNTEEEIDYLLDAVPQVIQKLNSISPFQKQLKELEEIKLSRK
ncbi:MAG: cysteine desulfurase NifS [Candidatus Melainabacteria bacterium GWF2_32_7]|nr:MAG: cysteine desulfurase NifS [Candidatus Melainabacteria bacterium GWF2_32_7]